MAVYAFFYSIPLALVGIPIVHFCCLRVRTRRCTSSRPVSSVLAVIALPVAVLSG